MTIDEKVHKSLTDLGVADAAGVEKLFAEVRAAMEAERAALIAGGAASDSDLDRLCKAFATAGWRAKTACCRPSMKTG